MGQPAGWRHFRGRTCWRNAFSDPPLVDKLLTNIEAGPFVIASRKQAYIAQIARTSQGPRTKFDVIFCRRAVISTLTATRSEGWPNGCCWSIRELPGRSPRSVAAATRLTNELRHASRLRHARFRPRRPASERVGNPVVCVS